MYATKKEKETKKRLKIKLYKEIRQNHGDKKKLVQDKDGLLELGCNAHLLKRKI